jgi:hypothetical protein
MNGRREEKSDNNSLKDLGAVTDLASRVDSRDSDASHERSSIDMTA